LKTNTEKWTKKLDRQLRKTGLVRTGPWELVPAHRTDQPPTWDDFAYGDDDAVVACSAAKDASMECVVEIRRRSVLIPLGFATCGGGDFMLQMSRLYLSRRNKEADRAKPDPARS
jgi:hypothetical protein